MRPSSIVLATAITALAGCAAFQSIQPQTQQSHALEAKKAEELKLLCQELLGQMAQDTPGQQRAVLITAAIVHERWTDYVRLHEATAAAIGAPPVVTESQVGSITELITAIGSAAKRKEGP